jgi:hypothetical protein
MQIELEAIIKRETWTLKTDITREIERDALLLK